MQSKIAQIRAILSVVLFGMLSGGSLLFLWIISLRTVLCSIGAFLTCSLEFADTKPGAKNISEYALIWCCSDDTGTGSVSVRVCEEI